MVEVVKLPVMLDFHSVSEAVGVDPHGGQWLNFREADRSTCASPD